MFQNWYFKTHADFMLLLFVYSWIKERYWSAESWSQMVATGEKNTVAVSLVPFMGQKPSLGLGQTVTKAMNCV
jgi:hypothetical protein